MQQAIKRILWVDDEVELLEPHLLFLRQRGYRVDTTTNGEDALFILHNQAYDLVLLDEQMPGRNGLEVLGELKRSAPETRVVLVTKSEGDHTMAEAVGRRVDAYLVKPVSPRQVLAVVVRLLAGEELRQQRATQDFASRFAELSNLRDEARTARDYIELFRELVEWELLLHEAGEAELARSAVGLLDDLRHRFGGYVSREYADWVNDRAAERPVLSVDLVARYLVPRLGTGATLFIVMDCMRFDQWRAIRSLLPAGYDITEDLYLSILPTATPYSRNALFSGRFPDDVERAHPGWWGTEEGSLNSFEDELLRRQLRRLTDREVPVHYEKVFGEAGADELEGRVRGALKRKGVVALVFNFVDLLAHGRSESTLLLEVSRDAAALRGLTRQWFRHSAALRILREAAALRVPVVLTSDHGSILCERPVTVFARRDATSNLRYKFGVDLRADEPSAVFAVNKERDLRFPRGRLAMNYVLAMDDYFFVYPTKLREYQARYRGSFLHGGVSSEEMILPVVVLEPR